MQVALFSGQNSETFDISHAFLPFTVAKLSTLKKQSGFWTTLCISSNFCEKNIYQMPVVYSRLYYPHPRRGISMDA